MKIVHFSDWHGGVAQLPEADMYICTGDMLRNYGRTVANGGLRRWEIDPETEWQAQHIGVLNFIEEGGFRRYLGSPDAPIVGVRGNHDFDELAPLFGGCNFLHEFVDNELIEVNGLRITGHRGIPYIYGTWNDECPRKELLERVKAMPSADIFLTHYTPYGILDNDGETRFGLEGMPEVIWDKMGERALHCFGHIHERGGETMTRYGHGKLFSNAATMMNVIDF